MPPHEDAHFLARSTDRIRLLTRLQAQPGSPSRLTDDLEISHRSVQRHLAQFVERGWAEKTAGTYQLTTAGDLVTERHADYIDALDTLETFGPFYRHLPDREHAPDPRWLENATLVVATPDDPQAPVHHYVETLEAFETETIRMISPVLSRFFHDAHAKLAFRGVHTELVMSTGTIERARELNPMEFTVVVGVDVLDLYRYPEPIEFGLTIGDGQLLANAYDEEGQLRACVEATRPALLRWANDQFERHRKRSALVEPTVSLPFSFETE